MGWEERGVCVNENVMGMERESRRMKMIEGREREREDKREDLRRAVGGVIDGRKW